MAVLRSARLLLPLTVMLAACPGSTDPPGSEPGQELPEVGARGTPTTLDVGSWNIEWFGSRSNGPDDEALQLRNARAVVAGTDLDIWGVAEIVDLAHWNRLEAQLPGYTGLLASEPVVAGGPSSYGAGEQKVGILYRSSVATLLGARVILADHDREFAGRPPLEVRLRVSLNGAAEELVVIVLHMKAFTDEASWQRRRDASRALKRYLDDAHPARAVLVIGDWNDDVDTSISAGRPSPFRNFVDDPARYAFPTRALSEAGISSTRYRDLVDHHLHTDELLADYVAGSAEVYRVDRAIPGYASTTSDHLPVLTRYAPGGRASAAAP